MAKYVKKPVEIEAMELRWDNWGEMCEFAPVGKDGCRGVFVHPTENHWSDDASWNDPRIGLLIPTLEGEMLAVQGDFVIKGIKGEFYPCKPDIFRDSYELINP